MKTKNIRKLYFNSKKDRMFKRNQNWIAVIVGPTGSGKTYAALTISDEMMEEKHDPLIHEVFSIEEFIVNLNNGKFKKGDIVVFEEAGVNISSKNWQSKANKNINFILQTCRHRNFGIIFTLPMYKFLDSATRSLIHTAFVTDKIDYNKELAYLKVYDFKVDALRGKEPYTIFPKFWINGVLVTMRRIAVKMPREPILSVYEARKKEFTDKLNEEIEDQLMAEKKEKEEKHRYVMACPDCGGMGWYYLKSKDSYRCKKCGNESYINPYKKMTKEVI